LHGIPRATLDVDIVADLGMKGIADLLDRVLAETGAGRAHR
jgi:hypothetical protein